MPNGKGSLEVKRKLRGRIVILSRCFLGLDHLLAGVIACGEKICSHSEGFGQDLLR